MLVNTISNDNDYIKIVGHILDHDEFKKMQKVKHHDTNRYEHSVKVSYYSYVIAKKLRLDYKQVAKGGLLHDFFFERTADYSKLSDKLKIYTFKHPREAVKMARKYFGITEMEEDMIKSHMFPLDISIPKYAESWIVNLVDTSVSILDFSKKFGYKLSYAVNLYLIVFLNTLK